MEPRRPFVERPGFQLTRERQELDPGKKIREFRGWCWNAARDLVSANPGKDDTIPLQLDAGRQLACSIGGSSHGAGRYGKAIDSEVESPRIPGTNIDVKARSATPLFDFFKIRA